MSEAPATFTIVEQTEIVVAQRELWVTPDEVSAWRPDPANPAPSLVPAPDVAPAVFEAVETATAHARSGSTLLAVIAIVAGVALMAGSFMLISTIASDAPIGQSLGDYQLNDLGGGTNFQVAFIIAGALMLVGALIVNGGGAHRRERFGAGIIGGAGLAVAPFVAFMWTGADTIADRALIQAESISTAGGGGRVFEFTRGVGFFVLIGAAGLGLIALLVATRSAGPDGREPLNTSLCVGGAIACLVAAAGQLIPERGFRFTDNFSNDFNTAPHVYSRVGMIAVVAIGGIIGFLLANRFGLGLAIGVVSLYVWQWVSSVLGVGDYPAPPALGNPGSISAKPHIVTTVGVVAVVLIGCLSALLAERAEPTRN